MPANDPGPITGLERGEPMQPEFLQQRGPKIFACNFEGAYPEDLISTATNGLSQIRDGHTGRNEWNLARKIQPLANAPGGFYVFHTVSYKVGPLSALVGLTLGAIPLNPDAGMQDSSLPNMPVAGGMPIQGPYGQPPRERRFHRGRSGRKPDAPYICRVVAHFEGGGWDYDSENYADYAMQIMSHSLRQAFPKNSGWYMMQGLWRGAHRFQATPGAPPDIPVQPPVALPRREFEARPAPPARPADVPADGLAGALAAARPGATVKLKPGEYRDMPNLDKPLTIVGEGPRGSAVLVIGSQWRIMPGARALTLRNLTIDLELHNSPLFVEDSLIMDGCTIRGGVVATQAPGRLELRGCSIERSSIEFLSTELRAEDTGFSDVEYEAIRSWGGKLELRNATFTRCGKCAIDANGSYVVLDACHVAQSRYGILARESRLQLRNCIIQTENDSIYMDRASTLETANTTLSAQPTRAAGA